MRIGTGAGLVVCALVMGIIGGLGWGWLRPAYVGTIAHGGLAVDQAASPANVEFAALGWFSIITSLIGAVLAAVAVRQSARGRSSGGVGALVWLVLCVIASVCTVDVIGNALVGALQPNDLKNLADGETLAVVPPVRLGVAWLVGPFVAALSYWTANLLAIFSEEDAD